MFRTAIFAAAGLGLAACQPADIPIVDDEPLAQPQMEGVESTAYANIENAQGETIGRAVLTWDGQQIETIVNLENLTPGTYAVHIHENGVCTPPDFKAAGGHWNPTNEGHGFMDIEDGFHKGDLRNAEVGVGGTGRSVNTISGVSWAGSADALFDADGAAIVVHERADDYRTDPAGDSGARRGCGVIMRS